MTITVGLSSRLSLNQEQKCSVVMPKIPVEVLIQETMLTLQSIPNLEGNRGSSFFAWNPVFVTENNYVEANTTSNFSNFFPFGDNPEPKQYRFPFRRIC